MFEHHLYHIGLVQKAPKGQKKKKKCDVSKNMYALKGTVDLAALALYCSKY